MNETMDNYTTASKGLEKLFIAQILSYIGILAALVPFFGPLGILAVLAGGVINLIALIKLAPAHLQYKNALYVTGIMILCNLVGTLGYHPILMNTASTLINILLAYFICNATSELLREKGDHTLTKRGRLICKLNAVCSVCQAAMTLLVGSIDAELILSMAVPIILVEIAILIAMIATGILYLIYMYKAPALLSCGASADSET